MFKAFNRFLTTRTSRLDQTKINILQLFHDVFDRKNVDYGALLWWDFMNNVFQKKEAIQYPRFIKLIIADLMKKFLDIPQRVNEDYHSIKDDTPLVSVYTTRNVLVRGMLIPDAFLTEEICVTDDFKEPTPRAHRTPTVSTASPQGKKRKQTARESSDDRERYEVAEATILSLTLHITALAAEAQENIAKVQEKLDEEEIEKMVEGDDDEESYASMFADSIINDDVDDSCTKIKPGSHKEHPEIFNVDDDPIKKEKNNVEIEKEKKYDEIVMEKDDDDDVEKVDKGVMEKSNVDVATGSMEFRKEKMQTPVPSPIRSPRKVSSSDKIVTEELTGNVMPELTFSKSNEMINKEMPCLVNLAVNKDRKVDPIISQERISKKFVTHAPKIIKELFRKHMQHTTLNLYPTTSSSTARKSTDDLQQQLYLKMKSTPQDQVADLELWKILKANGKKKEAKAFTFYRMETEDISERYDAPCFVNNGDKVVKKELIVALRGEIYFIKFIINPEEDDIEPGVVLGRSFLRLTKGIADFGNGIIAIYPDLDPFNDVDSDKANDSVNDWDPRPITETMKFIDQHKKLLDSVMLDRLKLDGEIKANEEEATKEVIKGYKTLREKDNPGVFILPIRLEAKIDSFALADIGSNINVMSYQIYTKLDREDAKPIAKKITILNHSKVDKDVPIFVGRSFLYTCGGIINTIKKE
ncbi:hypothetical protein Tco_0682524 [Tanacetum coccineum]|uniref:Reverse transcriptase domain-containing protein n=1 Tax=Tanacetum coccineum TaxID=301880 RepID=A0ABQ4XRD9_9ASTR